MPQKREIYTRRHSYTSHRDLRDSAIEALSANSFNEIPDFIEINGQRVVINDEYSDFVFVVDAYERPGETWKRSSNDWYTHIPTGLKVKLHESQTPDYNKLNGCGTGTKSIEVIYS